MVSQRVKENQKVFQNNQQSKELLKKASLQNEKRTKSIKDIDSVLKKDEKMLANLESYDKLSQKNSELSSDEIDK